MIKVEHLTKQYGDRYAVNDISFEVHKGEIVGFLGPNGAGKSTTMNIITGCLSPTEGTVLINGYDVCKQPIEAKRQIGYLPEQPPLFTDMTPLEYLTFVAEAKGVSADLVDRQVKEAMTLTDLSLVQDRLIRNLSKGYRQRVGIAQAFLGSPDIVILDEPTVGLDPKQLAEIRALIRKLGSKMTVVISSHILSEIAELCDHVIILSEGRVVADSPMEDLSAQLNAETELLLTVKGDREGVLKVLETLEDVGRVKVLSSDKKTVKLKVATLGEADIRDDIFFAMAERRYAVISMERGEHSLEEIFLSLTDKGNEQEEVED